MLCRFFGGVAAVPPDLRPECDPNSGVSDSGGRSQDIPAFHGADAGSEADIPVPLPDGGGQFKILHGNGQITIKRSECNTKLRRWLH